VAISNLTIPDDCIDTIKSYLYLDTLTYREKLIRKSIHALLKSSPSAYNFQLNGDELCKHTFIFRWYPNNKRQIQTPFCIICGDYMGVSFGKLSECCECKC